jgi:6-pyruvoyl tetrahydropterin synthase
MNMTKWTKELGSYEINVLLGAAGNFSCCYRLWHAVDRNKYMHGHALLINLKFSSATLDAAGHVLTTNDIARLNAIIRGMFENKTLIADDDPEIAIFEHMARADMIQVFALKGGVSLENIAVAVYEFAFEWLAELQSQSQWQLRCRPNVMHAVWITEITVAEQGTIGASFLPGEPGNDMIARIDDLVAMKDRNMPTPDNEGGNENVGSGK